MITVGDSTAFGENLGDAVYWSTKGTEITNFRAQNIKSSENLEKNSLDLYSAYKSLYLQRRENLVKNVKRSESQYGASEDDVEKNKIIFLLNNLKMITFIKKIFFFISFILLISSNSNSAESNAEAFVIKLTDEAKIIFNDKSLNKDSRLKKLNDLSSKYLDLDALANYTLGDYREKATNSERENFNKLFREYFIKNISSKLNDFADQDIKVINSKKINENNIIVSTKIFSKKDAQEIAVEWRIFTKDSKLLARDLVVEGLSLARTQKEEFSSIIASKGFVGVISALENFNKSN